MAGVILFNFAYTVTVPAWLNEKKPEVSVNKTIWYVRTYDYLQMRTCYYLVLFSPSLSSFSLFLFLPSVSSFSVHLLFSLYFSSITLFFPPQSFYNLFSRCIPFIAFSFYCTFFPLHLFSTHLSFPSPLFLHSCNYSISSSLHFFHSILHSYSLFLFFKGCDIVVFRCLFIVRSIRSRCFHSTRHQYTSHTIF